MAATASMDTTARLWDVATGAPVATLAEHTAEIVSLAFSTSGDLVLTGSFDQTSRLWDVRTGKCVRELLGHTAEVRSNTAAQFIFQSIAPSHVRSWLRLSNSELQSDVRD
jgi:dynein assembly factor with WDR repeat domains 1